MLIKFLNIVYIFKNMSISQYLNNEIFDTFTDEVNKIIKTKIKEEITKLTSFVLE
jgi:hypothetical protein